MLDDEKKDDPRTSRRRWTWAVVLPVLYVLSIGPVSWIYSRALPLSWADNVLQVLVTFYSPVLYAGRKLPYGETFLEWYTDFF